MKAQVLIIGGGATGTGISRDLALRGINCILVEKKDINAGASGGNHGLLHSGARYVGADPEAAEECKHEGDIIKKVAPHCIENTGGLFVAVAGDDEKYIADFPQNCSKCGVPAKYVDLKDAFELEPELAKNTIAVYMVEDASVDPFKLSLENLSHAHSNGTIYLPYTKAEGFNIENGRIKSVVVQNMITGEQKKIEADYVVNAAGVWAGELAKLAGMKINMIYSKGSLLVTQRRITKRVINRLRRASDADILVPGGTVSIIGTTSIRTESLESIYPTVEEVDFIISEGAQMLPLLDKIRYIRAYSGVRPLVSLHDSADDRGVTRGFALIDHEKEGIKNFTTITGGKLTTFRLMAEKTSDHVCEKLGISKPCMTKTVPMPNTSSGRWTEPGLAPKTWVRDSSKADILLCECEMIPKSAIDSIISSIIGQSGDLSLNSIGVRSRVGKGPCQGTFCSARIVSYMYDKGNLIDKQGILELQKFINERWKGQRPLLWDIPMVQSELQEAIHCGLFGLEMEQNK
ncbi:MAG: anaerobic glycerol-3-phosphate dehydrogenase subunit A [Desulfobacterales bacterium]|nr:anaerobic glycerol-3-phosphate dehydrogenase subunit A [Desulfobacterales bacterium]